MEIFEEEAEDQYQHIFQQYESWDGNTLDADAELISELRRSFHTLKGSGRMVGALVVGDLFWSFEELFNKVFDKKVDAGKILHGLLGELVSYLRESKDELITLQKADEAIQSLIDNADKLASNEAIELKYHVDVSSQNEVVTDQNVIIDTPVIDEQNNESVKPENTEEVDPIVAIYLEELSELLDAFSSTTELLVEDSKNSEAVADAERQLHTVKGGARMTGLLAIGDLSHYGESLLNKVAQNKVDADDGLVLKLQEVSDELYRMYEKASSRSEVEPATRLIEELKKLSGDEAPIGAAEPMEESLDTQQLESEASEPVDPIITIYLEELTELLDAFSATTEILIENPTDAEAISDAERQLHTVKGGARMTGLLAIGDLSHYGESLLNKVSHNKVDADDGLLLKLQEVSDELYRMYEKAASGSTIEPATDLIEELKKLSGDIGIPSSVIEQEESQLDVTANDLEAATENTAIKMPTAKINDAVSLDYSISSRTGMSELEKLLDEHAEELSVSAVSLLANVPQKEVEEGKSNQNTSSIKVPTHIINNLITTTNEWGHQNMRLVEQYDNSGNDVNELKRIGTKLKEQVRALELEADSLISSGGKVANLPKINDSSFDPLEMDEYTELQQQSRVLAESLGDLANLTEELEGGLKLMEKTIKEQASSFRVLQDGLVRTRMTKVSTLSARLKRIVRQTSTELGKNIEFEIADENCELDRTILEQITSSLEHLIRNSVAHGIELPTLRQNTKKPETGKIVLEFSREGPEVVITLQDDGQGIDVEKLKAASIKKGLISSSDQLSDKEAYQLILMSGVSTAESVNQVAGRGVGMDVVNSEINALGGNIVIDSSRGEYTCFTLRVPYNLATNQVMLLEVSDELLSIPVAKLTGMQRIPVTDLLAGYSSKKPTITIEGKDYRLQHLGKMLGLGEVPNDMSLDSTCPVILLEENRQRIAYHVDDVRGSREVMLKPLGSLFDKSQLLSSATILGGGDIVLLLNAHELIRMGHSGEVIENSQVDLDTTEHKPTVFVVDDSITVRKVTENLLRKLDYHVITATDGLNALEVLESEIPDIVLLDIEMPRMDGFELLERLRSSHEWKNLPVIMISSRSGAKHRQHAENLGATSFIGKPWEAKQLSTEITRCLKPNKQVAMA